MWTDCTTDLPRIQWTDSMSPVIDQFMHFPVVSSEYGETQMTELSSGGISRVHEQPRVIVSDWDRLPFLIFRIGYDSGFIGRDFTWMPMPTTIHDSRFIPYRYVSMELQERGMQSGHDGWMTMIRVVQHQHGGSFLRIAWDPGISVGDSATVDTEVRASFFLHEIGSLAEQFLDGLIELLQHRVALLVGWFSGDLLCQYITRPCLEQRMLHILQGGLGSWYHFQFQSGSVDGASGHDGIA
jgi:hypothetical protein